MKDLLTHFIIERPFLFVRYVIYALVLIISFIIMMIIKKYKNRNK